MISPDEIKKQALKWWIPILQSRISSETFFPKSIARIGKTNSGDLTDNFEQRKKEIEQLYRNSKNNTGIGYQVVTKEQRMRRMGSHELPDSIVVETLADYLHLTGLGKDWALFNVNYGRLIESIPELKEWIHNHVNWLTEKRIEWEHILKVCQYFLRNPRPDLYIRQLPIQVHTKFIEENQPLIQSLLDYLIPGHIRDASTNRFAERYYLRYDEPLVRLRILDNSLKSIFGFTDLSIPVREFAQLELPVTTVLLAENKMNFLTLPSLASTIAVWSGGGFKIATLKNIAWLHEKKILYWGDIDEHGFQILHQLRSYYPHAESMLMDKKTFEQFKEFAVTGSKSKSEKLEYLREEEKRLLEELKLSSKNRLEQERISQEYVEECFKLLYIKS
ncbi:MAG: hypothetical protein KAF40_08455 [Flavihumibacter sp.]|nr:hypothetical protein [Flavihumibacter sp.]